MLYLLFKIFPQSFFLPQQEPRNFFLKYYFPRKRSSKNSLEFLKKLFIHTKYFSQNSMELPLIKFSLIKFSLENFFHKPMGLLFSNIIFLGNNLKKFMALHQKNMFLKYVFPKVHWTYSLKSSFPKTHFENKFKIFFFKYNTQNQIFPKNSKN